MLGRLIILIAIAGALLWFLHWFRSRPPEQVARGLRRSLLWGGIGLLVLLAVTGRLNPLFAALAAAIPVVMRAVNLLGVVPMVRQAMRALGLAGAANAAGGGDGTRSSIRTRFLHMTLDHESGEMDGLVTEGPLQGRRLSELDLEQLVDLLALCQGADDRSAAVLEAYLDRVRGDAWREKAQKERTRTREADAPMTRNEALAILGLAEGAGEEEIRGAHRRLMQRFHPDRGGSDYLAAKINEAKGLLLGD